PPPAVARDGFIAVFGAGGREAAPAEQSKEGPDRHPVDANQPQGSSRHGVLRVTLWLHRALRSSRRRAYSASIAEGRATMTTSRPASVLCASGRTSSSRRRLILVGLTAYPRF